MSCNVNCPYCNELLEVEYSWCDTEIECANCGKFFVLQKDMCSFKSAAEKKKSKIIDIVLICGLFLLLGAIFYGGYCYVRSYYFDTGLKLLEDGKENTGVAYLKKASSMGHSDAEKVLKLCRLYGAREGCYRYRNRFKLMNFVKDSIKSSTQDLRDDIKYEKWKLEKKVKRSMYKMKDNIDDVKDEIKYKKWELEEKLKKIVDD